MIPAVASFAESAARAQVIEAAIRRAHPHAEIHAYLDAHGFGHLIDQPALGSYPQVKARRARARARELRALADELDRGAS